MASGSGQRDAMGEAELRRRLSEAEDTIRAIREGEVDALVVRGASQDRVFALGGEDSYRVFMEAMDIGAAALDASGKLIYANGALLALLGASGQELSHDEFVDRLGSGAELALRRLLEDSKGDRRSAQVSVQSTGGERYVELTAAPLELAFGRGYAVTFTDVTERIEAAAASESERVGRAILALSNEAVVVCDDQGVITQANAKVRQFGIESGVGRKFGDVFPLQFAVGSGLMDGVELVDVALSGGSVRGLSAGLVVGDKARTVLVNASPLRSSGEAMGGCIIALTDVTDEKAAERKQLLLMGELTHRVKNTLTLVLSIANRTAAGAANLAEFRTAFGRRLEALAATHNLLADDFSGGLTLEDLAAAELAPYVPLTSERLSLDGLEYRLNSDTAVTLGLIFHELVTNAVKYGALSNERGKVMLQARRQENSIEILWCETNGPPVLPPTRQGFGQKLILRGLGQSGDASTTLEYRPEGVICRMFVPASALVREGSA